MIKKNLCAQFICIGLFSLAIEVISMALGYTTSFLLSPIITISAIIVLPQTPICIIILTVAAAISTLIHGLLLNQTIFFFLTCITLWTYIRPRITPRKSIFFFFSLSCTYIWLLLQHQAPSTIARIIVILIVVLFGVLFWNTVRKTIAKEFF